MSNIEDRSEFDPAEFIRRLEYVIGSESLRSFSQRAGVSDTVLRRYLGGSIPSLDRAVALANAADVDFTWFALGVGERPELVVTSKNARVSHTFNTHHQADETSQVPSNEFTLIDSFAVFASAGHGTDVGHELKTEPMSFRTDWLRKEGLPADRLSVIRAKGDSMEPTISDNDVILVLMTNGEAPRDGLHVIRLDSGLFVKRLQFDPFGGLSVVSDNPAYKSYSVTREQREQLHIVGRVVWAGKKF